MGSASINIKSPFGGGYQVPSRIVVHVMGEFIDDAGEHYTAHDWLNHLRLSCHALVTPSGNIIRTRDDSQIAYHAKGYNTGSLGIEFLCPGLHNFATLKEATKTDYLSPEQYEAGVEQVSEWVRQYGITQIDRHSDLDPERRWFDPGEGFPWLQFLEDVR